MLQLTTKNLFYKEYPYKISCKIENARYMFQIDSDYYNFKWANRTEKTISNKKELKLIFSKISRYGKEIKTRTEANRFNIFCKNVEVFEQLKQDLQKWIIKIYAPNNEVELEYMLENGAKRKLCDQYPKNRYLFKVFIRNNIVDTARVNFALWTEKYNGKILVSKTSMEWLLCKRFWHQAPFMYVEDESTLSMVGLFLGAHVKSIEKFILRSSINTDTKQELECQD